jgi:hypothetical protein
MLLFANEAFPFLGILNAEGDGLSFLEGEEIVVIKNGRARH